MEAGTSIAVGDGDEHVMMLAREGLAQGLEPFLFSIRAETDGYERAVMWRRRDRPSFSIFCTSCKMASAKKYGLLLIFEGDTQGAIAPPEVRSRCAAHWKRVYVRSASGGIGRSQQA